MGRCLWACRPTLARTVAASSLAMTLSSSTYGYIQGNDLTSATFVVMHSNTACPSHDTRTNVSQKP